MIGYVWCETYNYLGQNERDCPCGDHEVNIDCRSMIRQLCDGLAVTHQLRGEAIFNDASGMSGTLG